MTGNAKHSTYKMVMTGGWFLVPHHSGPPCSGRSRSTSIGRAEVVSRERWGELNAMADMAHGATGPGGGGEISETSKDTQDALESSVLGSDAWRVLEYNWALKKCGQGGI